jgi:hypothetical protein
MHEHFYNVGYIVYESGKVRTTGNALLRTSKVPTLDSVRNHIRKYFLNDAPSVITISEVVSLSGEVYKKLGGDPNAPLLKENW